jgi:glucokinase
MIGAVDIGGTKIAVGVVDGGGRVLSRAESPTDAPRGFPDALDRICDMLRRCSREASVQISGIGIGSTGPVDPFAGTFGDINFLPGWQGANIVAEMSRIFPVPLALENDADAAALAEAAWGAGRNKRRLVYVTVGTGIGAGIVLDGRLYRGADQAHPEIGHHVVDPSGPPCLCGFRGCWESLAAGPAMVESLLRDAPPSYPHRAGLSARRVCELALQGDALARRAVERETYYLGLGLANLVTLFVPDSIVLGGSVMKSGLLFLEGIRKIVRESCRYVPFEKAELALASLGDEANLIGAARVWHHRFADQGGERAS